MKLQGPDPWLVAFVAAACGAAVGGAGAALQVAARPWQVGDFAGGAVARAGSPAGVAEVDETIHSFGTLPVGETSTHEFVVRNSGTAPLTLTRGATSCSCTVSDVGAADADGRSVVPPGGKTTVKLQWTGKGTGGPFRQQASIFTDDPRRPEIVFVVEGTLISQWQAVPPSIVLSRVSAGSGDRAEAVVFTYGSMPPRVVRAVVEHPQATQFFSLATSVLSSADVAAEPAATGGVRLSLEIRPGLPAGPFRASITLVVAMPDELTVTVPIEGTVAGDLVLAGAAWDSSRPALLLGTVSRSKGAKTEVFLMARGGQRDLVQPTVREVVPESLQVTIGERAAVGTGMVRIPISIVVPPGSRAANHLCSEQGPAGRIVLDTGLPDSTPFTIPVCVAIGP